MVLSDPTNSGAALAELLEALLDISHGGLGRCWVEAAGCVGGVSSTGKNKNALVSRRNYPRKCSPAVCGSGGTMGVCMTMHLPGESGLRLVSWPRCSSSLVKW